MNLTCKYDIIDYIKKRGDNMPIAKDMTRVTFNLKTSLLERVDEYARLMNLSRTSAVSILLSQGLDSPTALEILHYINKILSM